MFGMIQDQGDLKTPKWVEGEDWIDISDLPTPYRGGVHKNKKGGTTMPYQLLVLLLFVLGAAYDLVLNIVRYRSAGNPTPENLADVYDAETYGKWKRYSAEKCRLEIIKTIWATARPLTTVWQELSRAVSSAASASCPTWSGQSMAFASWTAPM